MKILAILSALDLSYRYGCTPAWWQLLKGLYENGAQVIATTYQGQAIESPWWRSYPNPCYRQAHAFAQLKKLSRRPPSGESGARQGESGGEKAIRKLINSWIKPRWERHLRQILKQEEGIGAIIVFTVPLNHFTGLPSILKEEFKLPVFYYDGDVPASLPQFSGFASGFKIYHGADLGEYDGFICNSAGGAQTLQRMGARRVKTLFWGVDPDFFTPLPGEQDYDLAFYGFGARYRRQWIEKMITIPSRRLSGKVFVVGGQGFDLDLGNSINIPDVPLNSFRHFCCRSKINLSITRQAHASVYASSASRPFELAAMECCIVSNPHRGLEEWFEPGREIIVVNDEQEALAAYQALLADERKRRRMGRAARERVLAQHTARQRAKELLDYLAQNVRP